MPALEPRISVRAVTHASLLTIQTCSVPALMFRRLVLIVVLASGIELVRKAIFS